MRPQTQPESASSPFARHQPSSANIAPSKQMMEKIHDLDLKYQNAVHQSAIIVQEEEQRKVQVRLVMLKDEKAQLKDQLAEKKQKLKVLSEECAGLRSELKSAQSGTQTKQRAQTREMAKMKAELEALEKVAQDSAKLLTEKLALSRELSTLKPELEHLRAQNSNQQTLIAEKLALQRQLDSLEVELAAEKRSKQRSPSKDANNDVAEDLRRKLATAEKNLAAEKKETARIRKEAERAAAEATGKEELLEERLDLLKAKLRDTQDELKRCRAELAQTRPANTTTTVAFYEPTETLNLTQAPTRRKRRANEISAGDVSGPSMETPDKLEGKAARAAKKRAATAAVHAAVGEKSHFSITPFLNKTMAIEDMSESPQSPSLDKERETRTAEVEKSATKTKAKPKAAANAMFEFKAGGAQPVSQSKPRGRPKKILAESSVSQRNLPVAKPAAKRQKDATMTLDKVVEEPEVASVSASNDHENQPPATAAATKSAKPPARKLDLLSALEPASRDSSGSAASSGTDAEPRMKKRKLLGASSKTIFDDDGDEAEPAVAATHKRQTKLQLGGGAVGGMARPLTKGPLAAARAKGFGKATFSPLKKDRRGVNASFLA